MKEFRVKFELKDGGLIMNRNGDGARQLAKFYYGTDKKILDGILASDARERGVKIVSCNVTRDGISCIVDWL